LTKFCEKSGDNMRNLSKFKGCLLAGAAGDALGYSVEFMKDKQIFRQYGKNGITEYDLAKGVAQISDDTQMTLFTATGLLVGTTRGMMRGIMGTYPGYIAYSYGDWLRTQNEKFPLSKEYHYSWLVNVPEMFARRAPGIACMSAIQQGADGTIEKPINNSKGCGGIMRVAPIGLYFADSKITQSEVDMIGAQTAALTHGHELGYIPAAALVHIISLLSSNENITVLQAVEDSICAMKKLFPKAKHMGEFVSITEKAVKLSQSDLPDTTAIRQLGEGWVAEETFAIAVYCALKYPHDLDKALIASVNHSGDSDSTGAVTGNILGAYLGMEGIPQKYLDKLELKDVITEIAEDLYNDCKMTEYGSYRDEVWVRKYIEMTYPE
jgi:ADP-ribosylglycohydrolase